MKIYYNQNVWDAALERIRFIYDHEQNIYVSSSGGKDSVIMVELAIKVAKEKGRLPVDVCFLDQESEYQATIDYFRKLGQRPEVRLHWFQVPFNLNNVTTLRDDSLWMRCWHEDEKDKWIRPHEPNAITNMDDLIAGREIDFYQLCDLMGDYIFGKDSRYVALIGMRAQESLKRYILMNQKYNKPCYFDKTWASKGHRENTWKLYPIYDWCVSDVWKAISNNKWSYNEMYDKMFKLGIPAAQMRVSSIIHETGIHGLKFLQQAEPKTFDRLVNRIGGINTYNQLYKKDGTYTIHKLPVMFKDWSEYRDYLLEHICSPKNKELFTKSFGKDLATDNLDLIKAQIKTILLNDVCLTVYGNAKKGVKNKQINKKWEEFNKKAKK